MCPWLLDQLNRLNRYVLIQKNRWLERLAVYFWHLLVWLKHIFRDQILNYQRLPFTELSPVIFWQWRHCNDPKFCVTFQGFHYEHRLQKTILLLNREANRIDCYQFCRTTIKISFGPLLSCSLYRENALMVRRNKQCVFKSYFN